MARILIVFGTRDGVTEEISRHMEDVLHNGGHHVTVIEAGDAPEDLVDESAFDGVLVGGSAHRGRHRATLEEFARESLSGLERMPSAFFSVNLDADSDGEGEARAEDVVNRFMEDTGWHPDAVAVIAGERPHLGPEDLEAAAAFARAWVHGLEVEEEQAPGV